MNVLSILPNLLCGFTHILGSVPIVDAWTIDFSPDSRFLASGSHTGKINIFGVESGKKESSLDTRGKFTLSIAHVSAACSFFTSRTFPEGNCHTWPVTKK